MIFVIDRVLGRDLLERLCNLAERVTLIGQLWVLLHLTAYRVVEMLTTALFMAFMRLTWLITERLALFVSFVCGSEDNSRTCTQ